jgi:hypothetical protein
MYKCRNLCGQFVDADFGTRWWKEKDEERSIVSSPCWCSKIIYMAVSQISSDGVMVWKAVRQLKNPFCSGSSKDLNPTRFHFAGSTSHSLERSVHLVCCGWNCSCNNAHFSINTLKVSGATVDYEKRFQLKAFSHQTPHMLSHPSFLSHSLSVPPCNQKPLVHPSSISHNWNTQNQTINPSCHIFPTVSYATRQFHSKYLRVQEQQQERRRQQMPSTRR